MSTSSQSSIRETQTVLWLTFLIRPAVALFQWIRWLWSQLYKSIPVSSLSLLLREAEAQSLLSGQSLTGSASKSTGVTCDTRCSDSGDRKCDSASAPTSGSSSVPNEIRVLICGASVSGCALALFLRKASPRFRPILFERYPRVDAIGGGFGLQRNGMQVIKALGVGVEKMITNGGSRIKRIRIQNEHGRILAERNLEQESLAAATVARERFISGDDSVHMIAVSRGLLLKALRDAVEEQGIEVHYGCSAERMDEQTEMNEHVGVRIFYRSSTGGQKQRTTASTSEASMTAAGAASTEEAVNNSFCQDDSADSALLCCSGDFLVGCDGIHSRVRSFIPGACDVSPMFTGIVGVGGFTRVSSLPSALSSQLDPNCMQFIMGAKGFFGISGVDRGTIMWWANLCRPPYSIRELQQASELSSVNGAEELRQEVQAIYGQHASPVPALLDTPAVAVMKINVFDIAELCTWKTASGRVLLIGDAAHAVSPNAGQGASLALEDAMLLARMLADAFVLVPAIADIHTDTDTDSRPKAAQSTAATACNQTEGGSRSASVNVLHKLKVSARFKLVCSAFEQHRRPRVEAIVREGRRRGADKKPVAPWKARIREAVLSTLLQYMWRAMEDWITRYHIDWETGVIHE